MARRVLIIEDDRDISRLVELHLKDAGYEVRVAPDGAAGLDEAMSASFDLIILDLLLPIVDGLSFKASLVDSYDALPAEGSESNSLAGLLGLALGF